MYDYDGFVSDWNEAGILPDAIQRFLTFIELNVKKTEPIVEVGCGNGLLTAGLVRDGYDVVAVDKKYPGVAIPFLLANANSEEFFSLVDARPTVVARRSLCLLYGLPDWMVLFQETAVTKLVIESLNGEKHRFRSSEVEQRYLESEGWTVERDGKFLVATRKKPKGRREPRLPETPELPAA